MDKENALCIFMGMLFIKEQEDYMS